MEERNRRKVIVGTVVSTTNDKTITVEVVSSKKHSLYSKKYFVSKKYRAHDEKNECKVGDSVKIVETRPLSATKHFRLLEITKHAVEQN